MTVNAGNRVAWRGDASHFLTILISSENNVVAMIRQCVMYDQANNRAC